MFKIAAQPTFTCDVPLSVPGMPEPVAIKVTFHHKNRDALARHLAEAPGMADAAVLHPLIAGWTGVHDAAGEPVPYSLTALNELLENYTPAAAEFHRAYLRELTEAKKKT